MSVFHHNQLEFKAVGAVFRKPQPPQLVLKVRQYTSNLYGSTSPICIAVFFLTSSLRGKGNLAVRLPFVLHLSAPLICTATRPPFVRQYFWKNTGGFKGPDRLKTVRIVNLLSVVNLLRVVIHYWKCSESLRFVLIYYILSSESLCVVISLQSSKTLRNWTPY